MKQLLAILSIALLAAACGTTTPSASTGDATPTPAESTEVVAPTILTKEVPSATVKIGSTVIFSVENPETWTLSASDPNKVELTAGSNAGGLVTNPGALVRMAGQVTVTLRNETGETVDFEITITE